MQRGVYTNVNGDIKSYTSKTAKTEKKMILPRTQRQMSMSCWVISIYFCCFRCVTLYFAV